MGGMGERRLWGVGWPWRREMAGMWRGLSRSGIAVGGAGSLWGAGCLAVAMGGIGEQDGLEGSGMALRGIGGPREWPWQVWEMALGRDVLLIHTRENLTRTPPNSHAYYLPMNSRLGTSRKVSGLSSAAIKHTGRGHQRRSHILHAGKQQERQSANDQKRRAIIQGLSLCLSDSHAYPSLSGLSQEDRDAVMDMDLEAGLAGDTDVFDTVPPGDEGFDISHEGGEFEVFDDLAEGIAGLTGLYAFSCPSVPFLLTVSTAGAELITEIVVIA